MIEFTVYNDDMTKSYTLRPFSDSSKVCRIWIKTQDFEGMPITTEELFKWVDKGYQEKFY